jgi:hypothetical protein
VAPEPEAFVELLDAPEPVDEVELLLAAEFLFFELESCELFRLNCEKRLLVNARVTME